MMILFIDHACHKRTKSAEFFLSILRDRHEVEEFYYDKAYDCNPPEQMMARADLIVIWEFLPRRFELAFAGKRCVFVPMYDNEWGSVGLWKRIALMGIKVVSFCGKITEHAIKCGVGRGDILDVRYAANPDDYEGMEGSDRIAALWERGDVGFDDMKAVLNAGEFEKVLIYRHKGDVNGKSNITAVDVKDYRVEVRELEFLPPEEYLKVIRKPECTLHRAEKRG